MQPTVWQVITHTPTWVWILLVVLIVLGLRNSKEREVNVSRMLLAPLIFMVWGIWTITSFPQTGAALTSYIIFIIPGLWIGYFLNRNFQGMYIKGSVMFFKQSLLPVIIVLINFVVKYTLNVSLIFNNNNFFHVVYAAANGLTVGLFFGGIIYTLLMKSRLSNSSISNG